MSHEIVSKKQLSEDVFTAEIEASLIAQARRPGQFVIISINNEYAERIPLTIADADPEKGTIRLIWQRVGKTTAEFHHYRRPDCKDLVRLRIALADFLQWFGDQCFSSV